MTGQDPAIDDLQAEVERLIGILNTPMLEPFAEAVVAEAKHQVFRWGPDHDATKDPEQWFWVLGYLAGKAIGAVKAGDTEKALHHVVTSGALLANWHRHLIAQRDGVQA
jgi:hypothetical protein